MGKTHTSGVKSLPLAALLMLIFLLIIICILVLYQITQLDVVCVIRVSDKYRTILDKTFRERQHPSALDRWTNSPFIGQQAGNCKSFTSTHYLADWFAMHHGPRSIPLCIQHHIQLMIPFIPSQSTLPEIHQFQCFTLKIQGQGHRWGQSLKSQCECNILSTRIPFVPCQWALPFLRYSIFRFWPWKSKVKVIAEGHIVGTTRYQLISFSFDVDEPLYSYL